MGNTFPVQVILSDGQNLTGFEYYLCWNPDLLDCVEADTLSHVLEDMWIHSDTDKSAYQSGVDLINQDGGYYHVAYDCNLGGCCLGKDCLVKEA